MRWPEHLLADAANLRSEPMAVSHIRDERSSDPPHNSPQYSTFTGSIPPIETILDDDQPHAFNFRLSSRLVQGWTKPGPLPWLHAEAHVALS